MHIETDISFTATSHESTVLFNVVLEKYLASDAGTMPALDSLLDLDPEMPMALLFRAYLLKLSADPRFRGPIEKIYQTLAARADLNDREQRHLQALDAWRQDQMITAVNRFDELVLRYPKDMLALRVAHYLHFYGHGSAPMVASINSVIDHWQPGDTFYGYLKGMQCFALEESGDYAKAEPLGYEALEYNRTDIWAAHALTHIMQMQGRFDEGIPFVESLKPEWHSANNFVNHMHWHQALLYIGNGKPGQALEIYDTQLIDPIKDDFYLDVCNAASLLWRLTMLGVDVGDRWQGLLDVSRNRIDDDELVFSSLHYLMAPLTLGETDVVNKALAHYEQWAGNNNTQGEVARNVGARLAHAMCLIGNGQKPEGVTLMLTLQQNIHQIGGSHAQRHLFDQMIEH